MRLLRVLFAFIAFLINYPLFCQNDLGTVIINGKPQTAIITLDDSIIQGNKYYLFPQGIYNLSIQAEGYKTYNTNFFQVFKNKTNSFDYKLKVHKKEQGLFRVSDLIIPVISIPLSFVLVQNLFPVNSLDKAQNNIDLKKSFLLSATNDLETPHWNSDLQRKTNTYNKALNEYETSVDEYNEQVKTNNRNKVIKFSVVSTVVLINSAYLYQKIKKRKVDSDKLSFNLSQNTFSLSKRF